MIRIILGAVIGFILCVLCASPVFQQVQSDKEVMQRDTFQCHRRIDTLMKINSLKTIKLK